MYTKQGDKTSATVMPRLHLQIKAALLAAAAGRKQAELEADAARKDAETTRKDASTARQEMAAKHEERERQVRTAMDGVWDLQDAVSSITSGEVRLERYVWHSSTHTCSLQGS